MSNYGKKRVGKKMDYQQKLEKQNQQLREKLAVLENRFDYNCGYFSVICYSYNIFKRREEGLPLFCDDFLNFNEACEKFVKELDYFKTDGDDDYLTIHRKRNTSKILYLTFTKFHDKDYKDLESCTYIKLCKVTYCRFDKEESMTLHECFDDPDIEDLDPPIPRFYKYKEHFEKEIIKLEGLKHELPTEA